MSNTYGTDESTTFVTMNSRKLLMIVAVGILAGLVTWGLAHVFDMYVYKAILCNNPSAVQCASSPQYAATTATVIGAAVALFGLVRLRVYRPLLIVLATFISLWGLIELVAPMAWYVEALICAGLYGVALGTFAWVARIRNFIFTAIIILILIIGLRLILGA